MNLVTFEWFYARESLLLTRYIIKELKDFTHDVEVDVQSLVNGKKAMGSNAL